MDRRLQERTTQQMSLTSYIGPATVWLDDGAREVEGEIRIHNEDLDNGVIARLGIYDNAEGNEIAAIDLSSANHAILMDALARFKN